MIPCLNEEQNVPSVVDKLVRLLEETRLNAEVLIVDDCSDDYTFREALLLSKRYPHVQRAAQGPAARASATPSASGSTTRSGRVGRGGDGRRRRSDRGDPGLPRRVIEHGDDLVLLSRYVEPGDAASIPWTYRVYQWLYRRLCRWARGAAVQGPDVRVPRVRHRLRALARPALGRLRDLAGDDAEDLDARRPDRRAERPAGPARRRRVEVPLLAARPTATRAC